MLSYSTAVDNARLDQIETIIGTAPLLRAYNGPVPADAETGLSGNTMLANGALPSDWMAAASSKSKVKAGTWTLTGNATLPSAQAATFFRIADSTGNSPGIQGTLGANVPLTTNANAAQYSNVLPFAATTGAVAGQRAVGTNIPAVATVLQVNTANVVLSHSLTGPLVSGSAVTFTYEMSIDNNSIVANQAITVNTFTINSGN